MRLETRSASTQAATASAACDASHAALCESSVARSDAKQWQPLHECLFAGVDVDVASRPKDERLR